MGFICMSVLNLPLVKKLLDLKLLDLKFEINFPSSVSPLVDISHIKGWLICVARTFCLTWSMKMELYGSVNKVPMVFLDIC